VTIAYEPVRTYLYQELPREQPGRRLRVFARILRSVPRDDGMELYHGHRMLARMTGRPTYAQAMAYLDGHELLASLPLRQSRTSQGPEVVTNLQQISHAGSNPELPDYLQDLANEFFVDVHEACQAFDDAEMWYPGVEDGIDPVDDDHVRLVIAAIERELSREERPPQDSSYGYLTKLPWAPLHLLPWRVQRALAERRRLRFKQWGIGQAEWERGTWSLWNVPEDPEWLPRWPVTSAQVAFR